MQLILFSKIFRDREVDELVDLALEWGLEGYDLCVRPDYPINPDNIAAELPGAVRQFAYNGLAVPLVTGHADLLLPDHAMAESFIAAVDEADVRLVKLGYFKLDPQQDYWAEVGRVRQAFEGWARLGEKYNVKICYHTHSNRCMGLNASMLMHLLKDLDPRYIGAYVDPGHLVAEGEEFAVALAVVRRYLSLVSVKDVMLSRQDREGHGTLARQWVQVGQGMVDWTTVFADLAREGFDGPMSIHCEFHVAEDRFMAAVGEEIAFYKKMRDRVQN